ncbi:PPOX class F420-dependent oxidoreductase [Kitasatospora sp. NPDC051853]|uniref:PPOX class F420-dependent oxidoreductase n=1 Tax=Kitasatospora sp. NPDC051853 TaxID=3364058 RepID=UPI0037BB54A9
MEKMTQEEWREFVAAGTRTGKLATVRPDGRPHVVPVWFVLDGDELLFNCGPGSVKGRNLLRDPRVTVCVDDEQPPFAFVQLEGEATVDEEPAALRHWAGVIGGRYMGADRAEEFGARNGVPGEWLVRVKINKVIASRGISD